MLSAIVEYQGFSTRKNSVPCHVDGAYATRHLVGIRHVESVKNANLYPLYSTVVFNLNTFVFYSFCSLSFLSFLCRQKGAKSSAQTKIVAIFFCSCHTVSTQSNIACRSSLFAPVQALRNLCGLALLEKYNATALQTRPRLLLNRNGLSLYF